MGVAPRSVKVTHQIVEIAHEMLKVAPNFEKSHLIQVKSHFPFTIVESSTIKSNSCAISTVDTGHNKKPNDSPSL